LGIGLQQLKDSIRGDDQIEPPAQSEAGDIAMLHLRLSRRQACGT
jgi:hypothetical protein